MPLGGGRLVTWETMQMIRECDDAFAQLGVRFTAIKIAGYDQAQARDELLAVFWHQATMFDDALLLDSDMSTPAAFVVALATLEEPLLSIPYEMRGAEGGAGNTWAIDMAGEKNWAELREGKRMMRIRGAGLGFTRIRRDALGKMIAKFGQMPSLNWISHHPEHEGLPCTGLCTPLVHEHPDGLGVRRRRPEDMSFFARARDAGLTAYALLDAPCWHDARGGRTWLDSILDEERKTASLRKRAAAELAECPDDLLGLVEVLDGGYDIHGLEFEQAPKVLDIGANVGAFAVFIRKRYPGAWVGCYEPHPAMAALCRRNAPEAEVVEAAVVGVEGEATAELCDGPFNQGERSIRPVEGVHKTEGALSVSTVHASKLPICDILKIDTEGCEREILENYAHLDHVSAVMTEWHSVADYQWMRAFLHEKGFLCVVDRARGAPNKDRELCFVRKGVMVDAPATVDA